MPRYNPAIIEPKWQKHWEEKRTFQTPELPQGEKVYILDMFPYPSGDGLHVGHPEGYTATDITARWQRMRGKTVLHPMGFDSFGLPAEEHAIKTGTPPRIQTEKNIATFRRQLKSLGFSYDWDRELATTDIEYFRWTQWIFLELYDTWYDAEQKKGRPIAELPIPDDTRKSGETAVRKYQDEHRLAYQLEAPVNWCPNLGTVLANEEVVGGLSERGNHPVVRIPLRQWMLRITSYADRLEDDLKLLDWTESVKSLQKNWIGKSTGAEVDFYIGNLGATDRTEAFTAWKKARRAGGFPTKPGDDVLRIYTTRPDTLFGATYMVVAPEHPFVPRLTTPEHKAEVEAYCAKAAGKSDLDRTELAKDKTGVFTGSFAINPVNGAATPIWVADYVLISYGTGAIMAVPAHDERDFEFAQKFNLAIKPVVLPGTDGPGFKRADVLAGKTVFAGTGKGINSGDYDGLTTVEFKRSITADLAERGLGRGAVNYKLRDWLFCRQRFWGEPFPLLHELDDAGQPTGMVRTVPADQLPVNLPELEDFKPHGRPEPPLDKAPAEWLYPVIDGKKYKRETNTMPQWAGSCWYYLRFIDPKNDKAFLDPAKEKAWMPVDLYIGGAEHAVLHLLYSRFWHKVLYDRGHVSTPEPFMKLVNQGMILGEVEYVGIKGDTGWVSFQSLPTHVVNSFEVGNMADDAPGATGWRMVSLKADEVEKSGDSFVLKTDSKIRIHARSHKMSKSRGNVVNPDTVVKEYGADSLRLYEMFMGPLEATKPWSMTGVNGVRGFLDRVWRMIVDDRAEDLRLHPAIQSVPLDVEQNRVLHKTIGDVGRGIETLSFNTPIARMMEFVNYFTKVEPRPREAMETFVLLLAPYAPHIAEELWQLLGHTTTLAYEPWPVFNPELVKEDSVEIPVQILGKLRGLVTVPTGASKEDLLAAAKADAKIAGLLEGKTIIKEIVVPGKLVNFVVK